MIRIRLDRSADQPWSPARQLALDEALLNAAQAGQIGSSFRTWELHQPSVVLGRSSKLRIETDPDFCKRNGIDIYRRCSGGASIVGGPGCLMYSVVLAISDHPQTGKIDGAHTFVMQRVLAAARCQLPGIEMQGICDLTWNNQKFSGNALRITRSHVLYHGTILYAADLALIAACLATAPRQPDYRQGRDHSDFVTNAPLEPQRFAVDLAAEFQVDDGPLATAVQADLLRAVDELQRDRYGCQNWRDRH
ncbi:lipoate--protein ligase family protein [Stieleria sp. TO1_6]|uniref:lipoate--protein ligase family protein n=1 Tax=Stieleria tagensis TaxID=2956795 RepID=UPI00209AD74A|nr:lipoate--protein ligase family protein [Stieleria tagensis]MCO8122109.1 lipoate--protein ligase family protein [Stieleria tagensis]